MSLLPDSSQAATAVNRTAGRRFMDLFEFWNRKIHYYTGLYLLLFVWLFAFSGLLLNHHWRFAEFWPNRTITKFDRAIEPPADIGDLAKARDLMRQLGISGEIDWPPPNPQRGQFNFRAIRPGHMYEIRADLENKLANVQYTQINAWGIVHVLHTFTGVRANNPRIQRDWVATTVWSVFMDAVAIGLTIMVLSSLYMWYGLKPKLRLGGVALALGVLSCGFFVFGLRWLTS